MDVETQIRIQNLPSEFLGRSFRATRCYKEMSMRYRAPILPYIIIWFLKWGNPSIIHVFIGFPLALAKTIQLWATSIYGKPPYPNFWGLSNEQTKNTGIHAIRNTCPGFPITGDAVPALAGLGGLGSSQDSNAPFSKVANFNIERAILYKRTLSHWLWSSLSHDGVDYDDYDDDDDDDDDVDDYDDDDCYHH